MKIRSCGFHFSASGRAIPLKPGLNIGLYMFTLVNDLSSAQFVTINVDGTVTSNDICVVISAPVGSSRFNNF